ncbi:phosphatidate cytidylyltransferase [Acidithiobacillus marinus]|uniref:Phosphatidate cytidylyltransferase n=1 Tax=Acidithiobacillus marinus TaxID=187490 RepID=A0A2I1DK37_9PROT|nr:CDP-archaeol synthase [Acidithiobacillus marinus]PKY10240.1 phosphatidate cytidylyltransferase [Acidithiobacillus marinus]
MLRQRLITAIFLFFLVFILVFQASSGVFLGFLLLLALLAGQEWGRLSLLPKPWILLLSLSLLLLLLLPLWMRALAGPPLADMAALGWILWAFIMLAHAPSPLRDAPLWQRPLTGILLFPAFLPAFWLSMRLQEQIPYAFLWVILIISAGDVGAMTFGKLWGRRRLIPQVSPGKTWEGLLGGLLASAIVGTLGTWIWLGTYWRVLMSGAVLGAVTALFAVIGDLAESYLKRRADCKDSGQLLPGHGGLLDRLDSISAGIPVFVAGLYYLGWWK